MPKRKRTKDAGRRASHGARAAADRRALAIRPYLVAALIGNATLGEVARRLNEWGIEPVSGRGRWHDTTVSNAIRRLGLKYINKVGRYSRD